MHRDAVDNLHRVLATDPVLRNAETLGGEPSCVVSTKTKPKATDDIAQVTHLRETGSEIPLLRCHSLLAVYMTGPQNKTQTGLCVSVCFHGSPEAVAAMASEPSTQSRVMFQATDKTEEPAHRKLGKLTVKYNRKDLQRRLDIEEWIDGQLHLLFDCEEEEIPELEIDIDELLELSDEGQRTRLQELLQECGKPKEDFINGLLYRIKGLRKMSGPLKK
ncbi:protein phosphatase 1 regulatory subunit 14B isoform X1 [Xiphias gladius]|uniref:protein phosphatase 1 regulatory subunit 14B isoform X1 n=2 Tax=Carangaria TaxID=1489904 RepID=UPI001A9815A1|nr:protein phosphatase 1 regulatory subunit 14B isoform X1 [Xiphias gladius]